MFPPCPIELPQKFNFVVLVVTVRIADSIKPQLLRAIAAYIETVESIQQTHCGPNRNIDLFELLDLSIFTECDPQHVMRALLRRNDQPTFWINGHADPRAFAALGGTKQFDFETRQR